MKSDFSRLKNSMLVGVLSLATLVTLSAEADSGMPKTFQVLTSIGAPPVAGQMDEIQLSQFKRSVGQVCAPFAGYDYVGAPLQLKIGSETYILDESIEAGMSFAGATCDLKTSNISEILLVFKHSSLNIKIGIDMDFVHQTIEFGTRDSGYSAGVILSKY